MMRFYCDRCGLEMTQKKYREGYRLPDPIPRWDYDDESEDQAAELILCDACKKAYIRFIEEGGKK